MGLCCTIVDLKSVIIFGPVGVLGNITIFELYERCREQNIVLNQEKKLLDKQRSIFMVICLQAKV